MSFLSPPQHVATEDAEELINDIDLETVSLVQIYEKACKQWKRKINAHVVKALPIALGGFEVVEKLDFNECYMGTFGLGPLLPVVLCCERLRELQLSGNGLRCDDTLLLLEVVATHPSITSVDLSFNEVGTTAGFTILQIVQQNERIRFFNVSDSLVIGPLLGKISSALDRNCSRDETELPLQPFKYISHRTVAQEEESQDISAMLLVREERERERQKILDQLPYWVPAALEEITSLLHTHEQHIGDLISMFVPLVVNERPNRTIDQSHSLVTQQEFDRVLQLVGCRYPSASENRQNSEHRSLNLAKLVDCATVIDDECFIQYESMIGLLRNHVIVTGVDHSFTTSVQSLINNIYDTRENLLHSFHEIDCGTGTVTLEELIAGLTSMRICSAVGVLSQSEKTTTVLSFLSMIPSFSDILKPEHSEGDDVKDPLFDPTPVDYVSFISLFRPGELSSKRWDKMTTTGLQLLKQEVLEAG